MTQRGFVEAKDIKIGDFVFTPKKLKNFDDEAYDRQLGLYKAYVKSKTNKPVKCHLLSIIDAKSREVEV